MTDSAMEGYKGGGFAAFRAGAEGEDGPAYDDLGREIPPFQDTTKCSSFGRLLEVHKFCWIFMGLAGIAFQHWMEGVVTARMCLITGLFGGYGQIWVLKSNIYPDLHFYNADMNKVTGPVSYIWKAITIFVIFGWHPVCAAFNQSELAPWQLVVAPMVFSIGGFFHYAADAQRYTQLKYKRGLITQGFWAHVRHPGYLGEFLQQVGMSLLNPTFWFGAAWIPPMLTLLLFLGQSAPNKEKSLSRYPEWPDYKARTPMLFPNPFGFCCRSQPPKATTELLATS